jgi:4-hydroxy-2-oxoheptanedioate aldolase
MTDLRQLMATRPITTVYNAFNSPALVEFIASLGFDSIIIDCEHSSATFETVEHMVRAARASGIGAIIRPERLERALITRYLESRPAGLMLPLVHDADMARRFVEIVRYAAPGRKDLLLIAMLESQEGLANLEEIAAVDGIDVLFFARVDLSKSMGIPNGKLDPRVRDAIDLAVDRTVKAGKVAGAAGDFDNAEAALRRGVRLLFIGTKALLQHGADAYLALAGNSMR